MQLEEIKKSLKQIVTKEIKSTFIETEKVLKPFSDMYDELMLIKGQYNQANRDYNAGILTENEKSIYLNKVRASLLDLINRIENTHIQYSELINKSQATLEETIEWIKGKIEEFADIGQEIFREKGNLMVLITDVLFEYKDDNCILKFTEIVMDKPERENDRSEKINNQTKKIVEIEFRPDNISKITAEEVDYESFAFIEGEPFYLKFSTYNSRKVIKEITEVKELEWKGERFFPSYKILLKNKGLKERMIIAFNHLKNICGAKDENF